MNIRYHVLSDRDTGETTWVLGIPAGKYQEVQDVIWDMENKLVDDNGVPTYDVDDLWECLPDYVEVVNLDARDLEW